MKTLFQNRIRSLIDLNSNIHKGILGFHKSPKLFFLFNIPRIDVKPDSIRTRDIRSLDKPLVYFNVINSPSIHPALDPLPLLVGALVLTTVAVFSVGLLIYFKKRKC